MSVLPHFDIYAVAHGLAGTHATGAGLQGIPFRFLGSDDPQRDLKEYLSGQAPFTSVSFQAALQPKNSATKSKDIRVFGYFPILLKLRPIA
ncbi:hypothetical protein CO678_15950 [Bradyrhizobium diazoefficiens]|uniref:hypothetical protein n=1 Tax=Bradyrhizobium diazoefficiens TaxID=1355477 RepID=UPI000BE84E1D|nr:hypothetical protein [Bradyrhizobium diazoefficiens]PDT60524.1 hypothetical protein CO678_15950 [Bradyrhizobium diazoefficiens]